MDSAASSPMVRDFRRLNTAHTKQEWRETECHLGHYLAFQGIHLPSSFPCSPHRRQRTWASSSKIGLAFNGTWASPRRGAPWPGIHRQRRESMPMPAVPQAPSKPAEMIAPLTFSPPGAGMKSATPLWSTTHGCLPPCTHVDHENRWISRNCPYGQHRGRATVDSRSEDVHHGIMERCVGQSQMSVGWSEYGVP